MKPFAVALACCVLCASPLLAQDPDYSTAPLERLVDDLALIDSATPGLASMATYRSFIAVDERPVFTGGVIGIQTPDGGVRKPRAPDVPPQMREIVRRGIRALPVLMQHLDDARPTKLVVGGSKYDGGFFMSQWFGEEYHARTRPASGARDKVLTFTDRHFRASIL